MEGLRKIHGLVNLEVWKGRVSWSFFCCSLHLPGFLPQYLSPEFYIIVEQYKSSIHLAHHLVSNAVWDHMKAFKAAISLCCNRPLAFPIRAFSHCCLPAIAVPWAAHSGLCTWAPNAAAAASCLFCTCLSQPLITTLSCRWPAAIPG